MDIINLSHHSLYMFLRSTPSERRSVSIPGLFFCFMRGRMSWSFAGLAVN